MGIFGNASESHAVDIVSCVATEALHDAVLSAVEQGWLLSFGCSRDGGAVSVAILNDEGKDRVWCGSPDEFERVLRSIVAAANGGPGTGGPEGGSNGSQSHRGASPKKPPGQKGQAK